MESVNTVANRRLYGDTTVDVAEVAEVELDNHIYLTNKLYKTCFNSQNIMDVKTRDYHYFFTVDYDGLRTKIKENYPLVTLKSKEHIDFCLKIAGKISNFLHESDKNMEFYILGGYFFEYLSTFENIMPDFYKEFSKNQDIDFFVHTPLIQEEIKSRNPDIFGNATHNYFFHDRDGFQHEVLTKKIPISHLLSELELQNYKELLILKELPNISIKFSPTAHALCIFDHFDLEPCKIGFNGKFFFLSRFFEFPSTITSVNDLNQFGKAPITRILKLLMKGFLHPIISQTPEPRANELDIDNFA